MSSHLEASGKAGFQLEPCSVDLREDQCFQALTAFRHMSDAVLSAKHLRKAVYAGPDLTRLLQIAVRGSFKRPVDAKAFFDSSFAPFKIKQNGKEKGFVTAYFQPVVKASHNKNSIYDYPILARPDEMKRLRPRSIIDATLGEYQPLAWVKDPIEAFMIQVQGSAVLEFEGGLKKKLVYDGRNGRPYFSIGRFLIESGQISPDAMSITSLKNWVRQAGQSPGEKGRDLLWRNESYVFFNISPFSEEDSGPIGGAGVPLTPFVSLATDRNVWSYATPFLIKGDLSSVRPDWVNFQSLMLSQDTGTAIQGPARGDIFLGTGEEAGVMASLVRHDIDFIVLLPR